MLKQRILTAVILIPLVIVGILMLPTVILATIFALFVLQGAWEWSRLIGMSRTFSRFAYVIIIGAGLWIGWENVDDLSAISRVLYIALFWWLIALVWVLNPELCKTNTLPEKTIKLLAGILVLIPAWLGLVYLHHSGPAGPGFVLFVLSMVWVADSGAYFSGKRWGKHKLAPAVSPGKTIEGALGATVLAALYAIAASVYFELQGMVQITFILLSVFLVPISILGDLFESLMKRHGNLKDSGTLLPGHGGVLDRIDSLTAVLPLFVLGMIFLGLA